MPMSLMGRLLRAVFGGSASPQLASELASKPEDLEQQWQSLIKAICVKQLSRGDERIPPVPDGFKDIPIGQLVAGFARSKHPSDIRQWELPSSEIEVELAFDRLGKVINTPYPLPEFREYLSALA